MNAKDMKQIAFYARAQKTLEKQGEANKYVEEKIIPQIEANARLGKMSIRFCYDTCIDASYAVVRLLDLGYDAQVKGSAIIINWENAGE